MAQSFTNAKLISALVQNGLSNALARRGYAAAAQSATKGTTVTSLSSKMASKSGESDKRVTTDKVSWVPDPVTGCYKPENIKEIDVAELRAALLGKKFNN